MDLKVKYGKPYKTAILGSVWRVKKTYIPFMLSWTLPDVPILMNYDSELRIYQGECVQMSLEYVLSNPDQFTDVMERFGEWYWQSEPFKVPWWKYIFI
jgi:hypothetical protein